MKKIYFLASLLIVGTAATAQESNAMRYTPNMIDVEANRPTVNHDRAPGDVIGSVYDFSTPANWTMSNTGTPSADWVIGTTAPAGSFSGGMGAIASTSGGNFAMFDSDGVGSGTSTQDAVIELSNSVDLSTYANVSLEFESYYRNFQGTCWIGVSTNGTTWTDYQVHSNILLNESTDNPETVEINISSVAANQATVWIRFQFIGAWDYAWMIDDVAFVEGYTDQLILEQKYMSAGSEGLDYYMIPTTQIMDITWGAEVNNNGVNDQTNTVLTVNVDGGGTYTQSSTGVTVPAFGNDSLEITTAWTPSGAGSYVVDYIVDQTETDQFTEDNDDTLETITVGGNVYARDNGVATGAVAFLGSSPAPPTVVGNYLELAGDMTVGKIQVGLSTATAEGEQLYVEIRKWDGVDFVWEAQSADHTVGPGEPGTIITLDLQSDVPLVAGDVIFIGAGHYGSEDVWFLEAQIGFGAVIYNDGQASQQNSVFMIRAEEVFVGIDELETITGLNIYPNPSDKVTQLTYNVANEANVSLTLTDLSGKVVLTENFGSQAKGEYNHLIATDELSNGVYFYTLTVGETAMTKKFVVSH